MGPLVARRQAGLLPLLGIATAAEAAAQTSPAAAANLPIMHDDASDLLDIDPKKFSRPTVVDNKWMPLTPGKQLVYEGHTIEDRKRIPHKVLYTVTDLIKVVNGIPTVVVYDLDVSNGHMEEQEDRKSVV